MELNFMEFFVWMILYYVFKKICLRFYYDSCLCLMVCVIFFEFIGIKLSWFFVEKCFNISWFLLLYIIVLGNWSM